MNEMTQAKVYENEIAKSGDFQHISDSSLTNLYEFLARTFGATKNCIFAGGLVQQRSPVSMNVEVLPMFGLNISDNTIIFSTTTIGPVAVEAADTQDRIDVLQVRLKKDYYDQQQRAFKDPGTASISYQDVNTKYRLNVEASVKKGVAGSGNAPACDTGWVKMAEILVPANQTTIVNADIKNVTGSLPSDVSTGWTTETSSTYRIRTIEDLKLAFRAGHKEDGTHADDSVKDSAIDYGLGENQVKAASMPIADAGEWLTAGTVEEALQELAHWVDSAGVIGGAGGNYTLKVTLDSLASAISNIGGGTPPNMQAAESLLQNQVIAKNTTTNQVLVADKRYGDRVEVIGFASANRSAGQSVLLKTTGYLGGFTDLLPGYPVFVGNSGAIIQDDNTILVGEWRIYVGIAVDANTIFIVLSEPQRKVATNATFSSGVGLEFPWPGLDANIPAGYLKENAAAVSRSTFADLNAMAAAASYASPWGPGDGSTTFNVPNKPGYIIRYQPFILTTIQISNQLGGAADGAVGINFSNRQIEFDLSGYTTYADAAGITPVDGINGSPNVTLAHNQTTPIFGDGDAIFTKDAVNRQGEGWSYDFSIDEGVKGRLTEFSVFVKTSTNFVSGDMAFFLLDKIAGTYITMSVQDIQASLSSFRFSSLLTFSQNKDYRLICHIKSTNALDYTLEFDNIQFYYGIGNANTLNGNRDLDMFRFSIERGMRVGQIFPLPYLVTTVPWNDNPDTYDPSICLSDIHVTNGLTITAAAFPWLAPKLRTIRAIYQHGMAGEKGGFSVSNWAVAGNVATLTFVNSTEENQILAALGEDQIHHNSYTNWRTVTLPAPIGNIPAGDYAITNINPSSRTLTFAVVAANGSGAIGAYAEFYAYRIAGNSTDARLFSVQGMTMHSVNDVNGYFMAGLLRRGFFQRHIHTIETNNATPGTARYSPSGGVQQFTTGSQNPFGAQVGYEADSTAGTPRVAKETHGPAMGVYWHMHAGRAV